MNRDKLLSYITMLDFQLVDLQLYLDTHPEDTTAIKMYNEIIAQASELRETYENNFGPLCSFRSGSNCELFSWINNPWPWENKFNFCLDKEAR